MDEYVYRSHEHPHTARYLWPTVERAVSGCHRVLDLGCGSGGFTARLSALGHEVVGVDTSTSGISAAKRAHAGLDFRTSADEVASFDAVVALEVIEHCYSPRAFVASMVRAAKPGGVLVLTTPYHGYWKNLLIALFGKSDAHYDPLWDHGHIKFFSERSLRKVLSEALISDVRIHRVGRVPPLAMSTIAIGRAKH